MNIDATSYTAASDAVLPHHRESARIWGLGGPEYNKVSFAISDALAHAAQRLNPRAGERVLDVATGTGWSARNAALTGALVSAVDISAELLAAARQLSAHVDPAIDFRLADAERLPFPDAAFERVLSTFGVMFAANHAAAAAELARVCRPGGRLVLATWVPDGAVAEFFGVMARHTGMQPPEHPPVAWGDPDYVSRLLGRDFELVFEHGTNHAYHDSVADVWDWYAEGFGPVRQVVGTLDGERLAAFRRDVDAYHAHYLTDEGLVHIQRRYLVVIGTRRGDI